MVKVLRKWIIENVEEIPGYSIEDLPAVKGGYETTLTRIGADKVEDGLRRIGFSILINGNWARAYPKYDPIQIEISRPKTPEWAL